MESGQGLICDLMAFTYFLSVDISPNKKYKSSMKVKTSITLSEEILHAIDQNLGESKNRSAFIEYSLRDYLLKRSKALRNEKDLEILNRNSKRLNKEAEDVLTYQVEF